MKLLTQHLHSLDPGAIPARERLEQRLGSRLTRVLLFALAPRQREREAA